MVGAEPAQLPLALADLALELVDQAQAGLDRSLPGLRQTETREQWPPADTEQVGERGWPFITPTVSIHRNIVAAA